MRKWQTQKKNASGRVSAEGEAASGEAGQSRGVVRAPRRSHLPAVRAVSGIYEGVVERAKKHSWGRDLKKARRFKEKSGVARKKCVEIEQIAAGAEVGEEL